MNDKIQKIDARGFRDTRYAAYYEKELTDEQQKEREKDGRLAQEAKIAQREQEAAVAEVRRRAEMLPDLLIAKGILSEKDFS